MTSDFYLSYMELEITRAKEVCKETPKSIPNIKCESKMKEIELKERYQMLSTRSFTVMLYIEIYAALIILIQSVDMAH